MDVTFFKGKVNKSTFEDIIEASKKKLDNWKANYLSKAGRAVLIKSNLEALPAHTMQCFELPKDISNYQRIPVLSWTESIKTFFGKTKHQRKVLLW